MTEKQKKFCDEYMIDLNATQAAIRAGYSEKNASRIASELLDKTQVAKHISKRIAEQERRTGINADRVVKELAKIGFLNVDDLIDPEDGSIKSTADRDDLACIESIKVKTSDTDKGSSVEREVKMASKLKALELLGKHLGMWNDKLNVNMNMPVFYEGEDDLED